MQMFTMNEAAQFLAKELPHKTKQQWWGYLHWNSKKWRQQDGVRVHSHLIEGELMYTLGGLKAFSNLFKPTGHYQNQAKKVA
ncbi:hypothetical protein [Acinetobacter sp. SA01]|jgi:hypothetical protein|uniref:hypothetical protein n=1 Tax=Acinetobacter sp. SA01 TaxID=1862567 RepID=UPI00140A018C|nr:hypothetical protein [Acinetobacter sp. SA01]